MRLRTIAGLAVLTTILAAHAPAEAGFGIGGSIGEGFYYKNGEAARTSFNFEVMPFYEIAIVSLDLGMLFNFEQNQSFLFRPGARLNLSFLYFRFAIPLRVNNESTYGFLFGLGGKFGLGPVSIFVEADVNMSHDVDFTNVVPVEFRAGLQFSF